MKNSKLFSGPKGRTRRETLTALAFVSPALILIFTFSLFPVVFALYVSLHKWLIIQGEFRGLRNYVTAIDNFAYLGGFAIGLGLLYLAYLQLKKIKELVEPESKSHYPFLLSGALFGVSALFFLRWFFYQLPEFLDIAKKMRGLERTQDLFTGLLRDAFKAETVYPHWLQFIAVFAAAILVSWVLNRIIKHKDGAQIQIAYSGFWLALISGVGLLGFIYRAVDKVYTESVETGTDPGIWPQLITITTGVLLLVVAWLLWKNSEKQKSNFIFVWRVIASLLLMIAATVLIIEIPTVVAAGDADLWDGLRVPMFFSLGTVPIQLTIALFLSVLLFQKMRGSEVFRIIYFLPYVTPAIATATVFRVIFSDRSSGPMNRVIGLFGIEPQLWLRETTGIFKILSESMGITDYPNSIMPDFFSPELTELLGSYLNGPSQALAVVIMLSIWTFVGYNVVIYLAGLGNISVELIEAAELDGANKWDVFRHITFPLLSPTTYFLSLIAVMGTFKAFNTIWILRLRGASLGTTDTFSVVIFEEFFIKTRYGYASALSFVLFAIILILTVVNNRIQGSKVFYG